jgi:hypothetical protein
MKKGELTTQQLVTIIILIVSFIIILTLIFNLNLNETTNKEICHNSVLLSQKTALGLGHLDCKTNYVCISGGEKCDEINPTITIKINLNDKNAKNEIMKVIADEMVDCWWMFGEGKIDYIKSSSSETHCATCSVIKFDKKIQQKFSNIDYMEFYKFLNSPKDDTQTYLKYLYNINDVYEFVNKFDKAKQNSLKQFSTTEKYLILTGIKEGFFNDLIFYTSLVKSSETDKSGCDVFDITKA